MKKNVDLSKPRFGRRFALLGLLFAAVFLLSFVLGRYSVSLDTTLRILWARLAALCTFGRAILPQTWTDTEAAVVLNIRLPRILCAILVGAALSAAGASYQGMFRNPMVSPDLMGASTGAGFGAALAILLGAGYWGITLTAFCFGLAAVALAYLVSRFSRLNATLALVLAGVMISSLFSACTSFVKLVADTQDQLPAITYWLMGSLSSVKAGDTVFAAAAILLGLIPLVLLRWRINLLTVSEAEARSLGLRSGRLRLAVILAATLVTSASVSVSGMIGWVGLVIPHFCRMLFGYDYRRLIPASILMGGAFLLLVDDLARIVTSSEIPLGILTSFVGAPVFLWLILRGGADRER
ncbi:MAG: iron ABC transporter permease [Oscillospiraceae bacterium]|nr:iron ABC transporter permease [Oscillospiraceae bacterium]